MSFSGHEQRVSLQDPVVNLVLLKKKKKKNWVFPLGYILEANVSTSATRWLVLAKVDSILIGFFTPLKFFLNENQECIALCSFLT